MLLIMMLSHYGVYDSEEYTRQQEERKQSTLAVGTTDPGDAAQSFHDLDRLFGQFTKSDKP